MILIIGKMNIEGQIFQKHVNKVTTNSLNETLKVQQNKSFMKTIQALDFRVKLFLLTTLIIEKCLYIETKHQQVFLLDGRFGPC